MNGPWALPYLAGSTLRQQVGSSWSSGAATGGPPPLSSAPDGRSTRETAARVICSNCGTENLPGARFCMECATPFAATLPELRGDQPAGRQVLLRVRHAARCRARPAPPRAGRPPPPKRRQAARAPLQAPPPESPPRPKPSPNDASSASCSPISSGSPAFSEGRDAEEVRELQDRYFETVREIIGRYGGTVEKFIGDAVMALWGAPIAHEDDAERAVRAGLDLVGAVRALGAGLEVRVGILTGEAAVTLGATDQGMVAGDMVNTASRLQSVAPPSTVLVGEATQRAAADAIVFEPAERPGPQGQAEPGPRLARRPGRRPARRGRPDRDARGAVRRPRRGAPPAQGPLPRHEPRGPAAAGQRHRSGRDRQVAPGLGVPQVHRRAGRDGLVARRPQPGLRRGDHVLGARRDDPRPGPPPGDRRRGDDPGRDRRDARGARPRRVRAGVDRAGAAVAPRARVGRGVAAALRGVADVLRAARRERRRW